MTPTWESDCGNVKLWLGDCLDVMATWPDGAVDAVITDPPYGIGFDRATWGDSPEDYLILMSNAVQEFNRLAHTCWVWQALQTASDWHKWFPSGFRIFASCKGFVQYLPTQIQWAWDPVVWWGKPTNPARRDFYARDWHVQNLAPFGANRPLSNHPSPRTEEVTSYIMKLASSENETVLDSFMGSGTTGVAAVRLGREFWGVEINSDYFEIAKKRIQDELNRYPLYDRPEVSQPELFAV